MRIQVKIRLKRAWKCLSPSVTVLGGILALSLLARAPSGCEGPPRPPADFRPAILTGIPHIRVLLTSSPANAATVAAPGRYDITSAAGVLFAGRRLDAARLTRKAGAWSLNDAAFHAETLRLDCPNEWVSLDGRTYRGSLAFLPVGSDQFIVVNSLDLESYLAGVLSKELYPRWEDQAYRAQAIAARTFAMYYVTTRGPSRSYDLGSTEASQVYGGMSAETRKSWLAVRATHGRVLAYGPPGQETIFLAQYSACCGGKANPASTIRRASDIPPLAGGQTCTWCSASSRYRWPAVTIAKTDIYRALTGSYESAERLAGLSELRVVERNKYGRMVWLDAIGRNGASIRIRADDLRLALLRSDVPAGKRLYSANCEIRDLGDAIEFHGGRGFGHGVGLCQWGAQGMAEAGATYTDILQYYYPQAVMLRAY
jgi:stage II sporulation protein D